jgi:probable HAF family extracellular repeat protein
MAPRFLRRTLAVGSFLAAPGAASAGSFIPLGEFPGGDVLSFAQGVSDDGRVVVGSSQITAGQNYRAFRWTFEEGIVDLGRLRPTDARTFASGVSPDGSVVVGSSGHSDGRDAFAWTEATGMVALPNLPGGEQNPLGTANEAVATTSDGLAAIGRSGATAVLWPAPGGVLGLAPSFSHANAISEDGGVIVGWTSANGWRRVGAGPIELLPLRVATDVSSDGSVIVGRCGVFPCRDRAALWSGASGLIDAGVLVAGDRFSTFNAVSGDGSVAVGFNGFPVEIASTNDAVVWDAANGLRRLGDALVEDFGIDLGEWRPINAMSISSDGLAIAGAAVDPAGRVQAFVALLRPQCSDGIDNDRDGAADLEDPACAGDPERDGEIPRPVPVAGSRLVLPSKQPRNARFRASLEAPEAEIAAHDPTREPTAVAVRVEGGGDGVVALETARWRRLAHGFAYRDPHGAITHVRILAGGGIRLTGSSSALFGSGSGSAEAVEVQLLVGGDAFCALFADETGATIRRRRGVLLAIDAMPPESCDPAF